MKVERTNQSAALRRRGAARWSRAAAPQEMLHDLLAAAKTKAVCAKWRTCGERSTKDTQSP